MGRGRNKKQPQEVAESGPDQDENTCPAIIPSKQNKLNISCDEGPIIEGKTCNLSCESGKKKLFPYYTGEDGALKLVPAFDESKPNFSYTCQSKGGWGVKYDVHSIKCLQKIEEENEDLGSEEEPPQKKKKNK